MRRREVLIAAAVAGSTHWQAVAADVQAQPSPLAAPPTNAKSPSPSTATSGATSTALQAAPEPLAARISPRPLIFPKDFGSHPEHNTEWWYLTGWLDVAGAAPARTFGFQVTFFRSRTGFAASDSRFAPQQLVFAHAALSDLQAGRQRHDQRIARAGFGVRASTEDTDVSLRDWILQRTGPADQSRYLARLTSDSAGFAFNFNLLAGQPTLLQGEAGFSRKGVADTQASHYYSHPQLALEGTLTLDGKPLAVTGKGWMDHEWSDSILGSDVVGWDWTGMNLDDGSALTAFQLRRRDGTPSYAGGSFRAPGGQVRNFGPDEVRFAAGRTWKSPSSGATYPVEWNVETPAGTFTIKALLDAQEQDSRASTGAFYWEGLSELRASGSTPSTGSPQRVGRGYLEMTGYVQRLTL